MIKGSIVALATPMLPNGDVDYASLQKLVQFHIANGTDAIVSVGTTGESATLPVSEHVSVVEKTVEFAEGKIPVIAGTGANSTSEAVELGDLMQSVGISGMLSVVPYYNKPQQRGMIQHFTAIADAADVPVILYNVPGRTVADLSSESVFVLAEHQNIVALKDATGDLNRLEELKAGLSDDFSLLSGDDPTGCEFMLNGGHGVISVTANIVPKLMSELCIAATSGNRTLAMEIDASIAELHRKLFIEPNPVMPKWALYKMGLMQTPHLRLPMVEPDKESQASLEELLQEMALI
ncbi:4-hydroxy-tetrahydrodipicolinate synthase [Planctobacterium marinum]|uniref:4-hydroxy-tetrahydrodipicolinate synthase n=1 Tax=Planctobacterium marinum TaxID=1631968 RepID=A0AA48HQ66_9ALTE|nr:4-hydroxy-tetrahydrodipicolinate synthase [Planctobacterium marinum]